MNQAQSRSCIACRPAAAALVLALAPAATAVQSWTHITPPGVAFPASSTLEIDPTDSNHLLYSGGYSFGGRLWESFDHGATWGEIIVPASVQYSPQGAFGPSGEVYLWVAPTVTPTTSTEFLYRRSGSSWQSIGPSFAEPNQFNYPMHAVEFAVGEANGGLLALWISENSNDTYGRPSFLYLSSDGGVTWSAPDESIENPSALRIIESSGGPTLLKKGGQNPSTGSEEWFRASSGWDFQWAPASPFPTPGNVTSVALSRLDPLARLFSDGDLLEHSWSAEPMRESFDGGATWTIFGPLGHFSHLVAGSLRVDLVVRHATLDPATGGTVQVSLDRARTWSPLPPIPGAAFARPQLTLSRNESTLYAHGRGVGLQYLELFDDPGVVECSAEINGSGRRAHVSVVGSASVQENNLVLWAEGVTQSQFGYFVASQTPRFVMNPGGSFGNLCLGGSIGRFSQQVANSGPTGELAIEFDWSAMPSPTMPLGYPAQAGETWRFQAWFRDALAGQGGSNFSDAIAVTLQP